MNLFLLPSRTRVLLGLESKSAELDMAAEMIQQQKKQPQWLTGNRKLSDTFVAIASLKKSNQKLNICNKGNDIIPPTLQYNEFYTQAHH